MPRSNSFVAQVWKCPTCWQIQKCPIPVVEVTCSHKHPHKKMDLIEGEPFQKKVKEKSRGK